MTAALRVLTTLQPTGCSRPGLHPIYVQRVKTPGEGCLQALRQWLSVTLDMCVLLRKPRYLLWPWPSPASCRTQPPPVLLLQKTGLWPWAPPAVPSVHLESLALLGSLGVFP